MSFNLPAYSAMGVRAPPRIKISFTLPLDLADLLRYRRAGFDGPQRPADIGRHLVLADGPGDGRVDRRRFLRHPQRLEHQRRGRDRPDRVGDVLPGELRRRAVHRLEHRRLPRMDVARRRHAETALEGRTEVGHDVAEQVVGDDDLELPRVEHHVHRQRVDVIVRRLDSRVLRRDFLEHALPQRVPLLHGVALVGHAHLREATRLGELKGVPDDAVDALEGVQLFLDRDFVLGARLEAAADAHVEPFRVLAEDDEVHVLRTAAFQRTQALVEQLDGPVVDVEVQLEARAEQDVAGVAIVGHARIAERADEDRVEAAQCVVAVLRDGDARLQEVIGAPRQMLEFELPAEHLAGARQHLHRFRGDFFSDSITRNYRDSHVCILQCAWGPTPTRSRSAPALRARSLRRLARAAGAPDSITRNYRDSHVCILQCAWGPTPTRSRSAPALRARSLRRLARAAGAPDSITR